MKDFYISEKITDRMDAIRSKTGDIMYLIKGSREALLIDTCFGIGNIKEKVEELTDLPLKVLLTHGHVDHAMGAGLFDDVYMNHEDDTVYIAHSTRETRQGYAEANLGMQPGSLSEEEFVPIKDLSEIKGMHEGDIFDLGDIHAEVYSLPGHTKGTMVVLIPEERILITGDAANNALFLFDEFSLTVTEYRNNLLSLIEKVKGRYDRCFKMHHDMEASGKLLENMIAVCDDILEGNTDDVPFDFMGGRYYIAKNIGPGFKRTDGGEGNIVYNKEKI